jgi:hypothetical protein
MYHHRTGNLTEAIASKKKKKECERGNKEERKECVREEKRRRDERHHQHTSQSFPNDVMKKQI